MKKIVTIALTFICCLFSIEGNGNIIKSNLGARGIENIEEAGTSYTASDYIKDDLVYQLDAIENSGYGMHDDDADVWIELINEESSGNLSGKIEWTDDSALFLNRSVTEFMSPVVNDAICSYVFSVEIVFISYEYGNSIYKWGSPNGIAFTPLRNTAVRLASGGTKICDTKSGYVNDRHSYAIVRNGSTSVGYVDSIFLGQNDNCGNIGSSQYGFDFPKDVEICAVRVYSRCLTNEELIYNYNIDKARFNLQ